MATQPKCESWVDLGYCNVYGSPYLKFEVRCGLPKGHTGPHKGVEHVNVAPTHERGDKIKKGSLKADRVLIQWEVE